ncbi:MAG: hypothetical protein ABIL62_15315 [Planctomycetota bacterium]
MAFDSKRNLIVLHGGCYARRDTWEYDGTDWTRTLQTGPLGSGEDEQMVYHPGLQACVKHPISPGDWYDTYIYDGTSWTLLETQQQIPDSQDGGYGSGMAYDSWRGVIVMLSRNGDTYELVKSVLLVEIDIKPGSYPNVINLGSHGLIPVAILSDEGFDATTVDPGTIELAGASVVKRGKGNKFMAHKEDADGDGLLDLVVQVATDDIDASLLEEVEEDNVIYVYAVLTGSTYDGQDIEGRDEITIVPPEQ